MYEVDSLVSGTPHFLPLCPLGPHLAQLALEFTSDPGVGTDMERTAQPTCHQGVTAVCLPISLQSSLPSNNKAMSCLIWAGTLQYPVDVTVTTVTSQQTGFLQPWRKLVAVLGSGPRAGSCPHLRSPSADEGLKACGPTGSSLPSCAEASSLL